MLPPAHHSRSRPRARAPRGRMPRPCSGIAQPPAQNLLDNCSCMPAQQFVIALPNQPGALATVLELFAEQRLDLRSVSAHGQGEHGGAVVVLNDAAAARQILVNGGYAFSEAEA